MKYNTMKTYWLGILCLIGAVVSNSVLRAETELVRTELKFLCPVNVPNGKVFYTEDFEAKAPVFKAVDVATANMLHGGSYHGRKTVVLSENKEGTKIVGKFELKSTNRSTLVLLVPQSTAENYRYRCFTLSGDEQKMPRGSRFFINLSKVSVRGEWGKIPFERGSDANKRFVVAPLKTKIVSALDSNSVDQESQAAYMEFEYRGGWRPLFASRWFHTPTDRHFVFIIPGERSGKPRIKVVSEDMRSLY